MLTSLALVLLQGLTLPQARTVQGDAPWVLNQDGMQFVQEGDLNLQIIRHPVLSRDGVELHASMALFWLDPEVLRDRRVRGSNAEGGEPQEDQKDLLDTFGEDPSASALVEVYFEGPVEYYVDGNLAGSATGFYLNLREREGWIANAELLLDRRVKDRDVTWRARAEWMQRQPDGTLRSNEAVITPCVFVDQHLQVQTTDLEVARADPNDESSFEVSLHGNSLRAYGLVGLPLPPIDWNADSEGFPVLPELKLGSSARFGSFIETGLSFDPGGVGDVFHSLLGGDAVDAETGKPVKRNSDAHVGVSWLGSRGILLDLGLELKAEDRYRWNMAIGGLLDGAEDRGLIRVDESERSKLRLWTRSRGRYFVGDESWFDLAISTESDPGVQSEFYEKRFLNYEERENYVHWRQASNGDFLSGRLKVRVDSDRTQTEEFPSLRALFDRRPVASIAGLPVLYSANSTLAWLQRVEGNPNYESPFAQHAPFADGLGNRHSLRFDTTHRFELPVELGHGLKFTPYVQGRSTAWDQDTLQTDQPARLDLNAGARLTTAFWKHFDGGTTGQLAPFIEVDANLLHETGGGDPVVFDAADFETGFSSQALGLRSRFFGWAEGEELDIELSTRHFEKGSFDDLQTVDVFAGLQTHLFTIPVGLSHNGRYDTDAGNSMVSRSTLGFRPTEDLGIELSHSRALDELFLPYYEAATVRGLYRWTEKWEFEGSQTVSILEDTNLVHEAIIRRYGHDLVFEVGVQRVAGEGGTTITFRVRPELLFRRSRIGFANHR